MSAQESPNRKKRKIERFLDGINRVIPWVELSRLAEASFSEMAAGRECPPMEAMLRVYVLQQFYDMDDLGMEEAIGDRRSFQAFIGMEGGGSDLPSESNIMAFRHALRRHGLESRMLEMINRALKDNGLAVLKGKMEGASIERKANGFD